MPAVPRTVDVLVITSGKGGGKCVCPRSFVCLLPRLLKNACMDLGEMSRVDRYRDMDDRIICLGSRLKLWQIKMNGVSQRNPIRMKSKRTNRISRKQNPNSYRTLIVTLILYNTSEFHKNESSVLTVFFLLFRIDSVDYSSEFDLSRKQPGVISARKPEARMAQSAGDVLGEGGSEPPPHQLEDLGSTVRSPAAQSFWGILLFMQETRITEADL